MTPPTTQPEAVADALLCEAMTIESEDRIVDYRNAMGGTAAAYRSIRAIEARAALGRP